MHEPKPSSDAPGSKLPLPTALPRRRQVAPKPIPPATPLRPRRKLCVGMSTYDDYDGVYFSVQAVRLYHAEVADQIEILVIDNNPTGPAGEALQSLDESIDNYRYVPAPDAVGCIARDRIFGEANAEYVLVMDCHVLLLPGALKRLIAYFDANPTTNDLLQGPLIKDDLKTVHTHFEAIWSDGFYGRWQTDPRGLDPDSEPFDIPMQGCGVFASRQAAWPGFNNRFRGFGAEEAYIHEKFRQAGGRTLCLPFLRWLHRFERPQGAPYPVRWSDRIRNHMIGWQELGMDLAPISAHFSEIVGEVEAEEICVTVANEMHSPLFGFDAVYYSPADRSAAPRGSVERQLFERLYIADRVIAVDPLHDNADASVRRILTLRNIIAQAQKSHVETLLVIERLDEMGADAQNTLRDSIDTLTAGDANGFVLATGDTGDGYESETVAIALHRRLFERLIDELPAALEPEPTWLAENTNLEGYLRGAVKPAR